MAFFSKEMECPFAGKLTRFWRSKRESTIGAAGHIDYFHRDQTILINTQLAGHVSLDEAKNHAGFIAHAIQAGETIKFNGEMDEVWPA